MSQASMELFDRPAECRSRMSSKHPRAEHDKRP